MTAKAPARELILASSSPYRRELLARLRLAFSQAAPGVAEDAYPGEAPEALAARLALAKARAVAARARDALVIGSDQVAERDGAALGKPGTRAANIAQLLEASGRDVRFHTGLALVDSMSDREHVEVVPFTVRFRTLTRAEIERYVDLEDARDCAGGFRSEGLGSALFEALVGEDPSALVGLPLIRLSALLAEFGLPVLGAAHASDAGPPAR